MSNPIIVPKSAIVRGNVAHDEVDLGEPLKIGGKAITGSPSAVADGDRVNQRYDELGHLAVMVGGDGSTPIAAVSAIDGDGRNAASVALFSMAAAHYFNGTSWDRVRGNTEITVLATAARTASTNSADLTNYNHRGAIITLEVTTDPGGGETLQVLVQHKDVEGTVYETLLDDGANTTPGVRTVIVYPGIGAAANDVTTIAGFPLPRTWRVRVVHSASGTWNYSIGASMIL